ncbi:MAG: hypothetical protein KC549_19000, partial [Myxococcales bacterium]|nr:hypothetical protein [Myxococcales bacterium]
MKYLSLALLLPLGLFACDDEGGSEPVVVIGNGGPRGVSDAGGGGAGGIPVADADPPGQGGQG